MDNKKIPTNIGVMLIVIIAVTVGMLVWKFEKQERPILQMSNIAVQKKQLVNKNPLDNFKISDFNNWKIYNNEKIGMEMNYPQELYINGSDEKAFFDYLSPDDSAQKNEGSTLLHFNISQEQKTAKQYIDENKLNTLQNFKQAQIQPNGSSAEQITYTDAFAGGMMYTILIQNGTRLIIVHYAGDNKLEDTFNKMLSTVNVNVNVNKTEKVSFCGKNFDTEVIILNNIDIVKRIATLSQNNKYGICENISTNSPEGKFSSSIKKQNPSDVDYTDGIYFVTISVLNFKIDINANDIHILGAFAGEPALIGKLK